VRLVASGYRWVHGSATEMAGGAPFPLSRHPRYLPLFGAKIMAEARSRELVAVDLDGMAVAVVEGRSPAPLLPLFLIRQFWREQRARVGSTVVLVQHPQDF
jgi:hypothetical protein